jgi:hypothetical protein
MERRAASQGDPSPQREEGHHGGGHRLHARADHPTKVRRWVLYGTYLLYIFDVIF